MTAGTDQTLPQGGAPYSNELGLPPALMSTPARRYYAARAPDSLSNAKVAADYNLAEDTVATLRRIYSMHMTEKNLTEIAEVIGVTRERVRQIIADLGLESRRSLLKKRNEALLKDAVMMDDPTLAEKYNISVAMVSLILRKNGFNSGDDKRLKIASDKVMDGMSIRRAARETGVTAGTLSAYLKDQDVESVHGRWRSLDHRLTIIPRMRAEGRSFYEIRKALSEIEGRPVGEDALRLWMARHGK